MLRLNQEAVIAALQRAPLFAGMDSLALQELACCCLLYGDGVIPA